jgi:hypothetical protein
MSWRGARTVLFLFSAAAVVLTVVLSKDGTVGATVSDVIVIDSSTTFAPPPAGSDEGILSWEDALALFQAADPGFVRQPDLQASLGLYTARSGDGSYRFKDTLSWGYSWHACPPSPPVAPGAEVPSPEPSPCVAWLFLDARTGEMLEGLYEA